MARGLQMLGRGLAVLQTEHGEAFRLADDTEFNGWRGKKPREVQDIGTVEDTTIATTDTIATLPPEGSIVTHVATGLTFKVISANTETDGRTVIVVNAEPR